MFCLRIDLWSKSAHHPPSTLPSATGIFLVLRKALSYRERFDRSSEQLANSPFLSVSLAFVYWRFLLKARIESVKREKRKKGGDEKEQKDYGCLKLICVRFERAAGVVSIGTTINVGLIPKLFSNFFARLKFYEFPPGLDLVLHSIAGIAVRKREAFFCKKKGRKKW